ncbi:MAG: cellulase family glycosylhydrolase, partial [Mariniphaga sp.]
VFKAAMNDGTRMNPQQLENLIKECVENNMIAMPELHDATGKDGSSREWELIMDYWSSEDVKAIIKKYEKFILLNIANETFSGKVTQEWENLYKSAITTLRKAGYKCPLVIDAPRYGRYVEAILSNGQNLLQHDPEKNIIFSWHPWNTFTVKSDIKNGIDAALEQNLCMVIGEFGQPGYYEKGDPDVPHYIMEYSQEKGTGWISWDWYNKGEQHEHISNHPDDQCNGTDCGDPIYTDFGRLVLFDHEASISKTALKVQDDYFLSLNCLPTSAKTNEKKKAQSLRMYPNPASGYVYIENFERAPMSISIINHLGKIVLSKNIEGKHKSVRFQLSPGVYLVTLIWPDKRETKQLIVY